MRLASGYTLKYLQARLRLGHPVYAHAHNSTRIFPVTGLRRGARIVEGLKGGRWLALETAWPVKRPQAP